VSEELDIRRDLTKAVAAQRRPGLEYAAKLARDLAANPDILLHQQNIADEILIQFAERLERLAEEA